ncbi:MAG: BamA/TamA family outer membrane protein [Gammaproteobacteria bacterium]|nr:BamA/TamA family outer membrane protein [Gammaproteobacteria bacterium]
MMHEMFSIFRIFLLLTMLLPMPVLADQVISAIIFEGNDVTEESIMRLEMLVGEGDPVDISKIDKSVQYIRNLRLFEWVRYRLDEDASTDDVTLVISVRERYYLVPLPTFRINGDNELEYGAKLRWDNVAGLNHQLKWKVLNKGSSNGIREYSNEIDYIMPRIFLSRYQLILDALNARDVDDDPDTGLELQRSWAYGFDLMKWLNKAGISKGLFAAGGIHYKKREITSLEPSINNEEVLDAIVYELRIGTDIRYEYDFNRSGRFLEYKIGYTGDDETPGSSSSLVKQEIRYVSLNSYSQNPPVNFNYQVVIGQSNDDFLGDKAFSIGGNTNLRGYDTGEFRGNAILRANFEYLSIFDESPLLRKVFFFDTGDVPEKLSDLKLSDFKSGAGAGIRWKIRRFVRVNLRLDAAYAFETDDIHYSFGLSSTF